MVRRSKRYRAGGSVVALAAIMLVVCAETRAQQHSLLVSTSGDAATASGRHANIDDEEILVYTPSDSAEPAEYLSDLAWEVIRGDADGDGRFDEEPGEIDAWHVSMGTSARPLLFDALVSFSATERFLGDVEVEDGDVVRILPGGGVDVVFPESVFTMWTGTLDVDVDAFAIDEAGDVFFSFADTEETAYPTLISENGDDPMLPDGTLFVVRAGESAAHILYTESEVLELVRAALSVSNSSIGDLQGLCPDPSAPGELCFVISSTSSMLEGTVFSTAGGGSVATVNGMALHGSSFGFETEEALDALSIVAAVADPIQIQVDDPDVPAGDASQVVLRILHGTPGGRARIIASPAALPVLAPVPNGLGGVGMYYVDTNSALFANSLVRPKFEVTLDANGEALFSHPPRPIPAGIQRLLQVVDLETSEISEPLVLEIVAP